MAAAIGQPSRAAARALRSSSDLYSVGRSARTPGPTCHFAVRPLQPWSTSGRHRRWRRLLTQRSGLTDQVVPLRWHAGEGSVTGRGSTRWGRRRRWCRRLRRHRRLRLRNRPAVRSDFLPDVRPALLPDFLSAFRLALGLAERLRGVWRPYPSLDMTLHVPTTKPMASLAALVHHASDDDSRNGQRHRTQQPRPHPVRGPVLQPAEARCQPAEHASHASPHPGEDRRRLVHRVASIRDASASGSAR